MRNLPLNSLQLERSWAWWWWRRQAWLRDPLSEPLPSSLFLLHLHIFYYSSFSFSTFPPSHLPQPSCSFNFYLSSFSSFPFLLLSPHLQLLLLCISPNASFSFAFSSFALQFQKCVTKHLQLLQIVGNTKQKLMSYEWDHIPQSWVASFF